MYETNATTCPVLGAFIEVLDDRLPDSRLVLSLAKEASGTRAPMVDIGYSDLPVERAYALTKAAVNTFAPAGLRVAGMVEQADALAAATDFDGHDHDPGDTDATDAAYLIAYRAVYAANAMRGGHTASLVARAAGDAARAMADAELHAAYTEIAGKTVRYFNSIEFAIKGARFAAHCACDVMAVADIEEAVTRAVSATFAVTA